MTKETPFFPYLPPPPHPPLLLSLPSRSQRGVTRRVEGKEQDPD